MMKSRPDEVDVIVTKAQKLGLDYKIIEPNKWIIYLKNNWALFQIESGWLLSVKGNPQMYISNAKALVILEQDQNHYYL